MKKEHLIDRQGRTFVLFAGLLDEAHSKGLKSIRTELLQAPRDDNGWTTIVQATVEMEDGRVFQGIGDADKQNVGRNIVPHAIRMAETRSKARALRDAINVSAVSIEETSDFDEPDDEPPASRRQTSQAGRQPAAASQASQRQPAGRQAASASQAPANDGQQAPPIERLRAAYAGIVAEATIYQRGLTIEIPIEHPTLSEGLTADTVIEMAQQQARRTVYALEKAAAALGVSGLVKPADDARPDTLREYRKRLADEIAKKKGVNLAEVGT